MKKEKLASIILSSADKMQNIKIVKDDNLHANDKETNGDCWGLNLEKSPYEEMTDDEFKENQEDGNNATEYFKKIAGNNYVKEEERFSEDDEAAHGILRPAPGGRYHQPCQL